METFEKLEQTLPPEREPAKPARLFLFRSSAKTGDLPAWSPGERLLFRFTFSYLVLYILPFPLLYIPYVAVAAGWYQKLWRAIVPWSKYTRSQTIRSPSGSNSNTAHIRQRKLRPVGGIPRSSPRCVPTRSNSATTAFSAPCSTVFSLRWSGNAAREAR